MTTEPKPRKYALLSIILTCVLLIGTFTVIQNIRKTNQQQQAYNQLQGYVLTDDGINTITQTNETIETTPVLKQQGITTFRILSNNLIIYTTNADPEDETKINIHTYNTKTKETQEIFISDTTHYYTELRIINTNLIGVIQHNQENNTRTITTYNTKTQETGTIRTPAADNTIVEWETSPTGNTIIFRGTTNDMYLHNTGTGKQSLIGTHDGAFGYLQKTTAWLSNLSSDNKMTILNTETQQTKPVTLTSNLNNQTFLNGTLLPTSNTQKPILWLATGFFETTKISQKIITITGEHTSTLYDLTLNNYTLYDRNITFNKNKQLTAVPVTDAYQNNSILIISTTTGELLTTFFGKQFIPIT